MINNLSIILLLFILNSCLGTGDAPGFDSGKEPPSHQQWDKLVKEHVTPGGWVDYKTFMKDTAELNSYFDTLTTIPPDNEWSKNEKLAYWLNIYNAFTVKLILDNYPVESINPTIAIISINDVFTMEFIEIGDEVLSLNNVEHGILRDMNEPRIHFAVNCASVSCPKLRDEAYTADKMDTQLGDQADYFINKSGENESTPDEVKLSKIFSWYKGDFTEEGSLIDYINKFSDVKIYPGADISYKDYDWALNSIENREGYRKAI